MSNQYRNKPVVIDAVQYCGGNKKEILEFTNGAATINPDVDSIQIPTLEGDMRAEISDWIVKGVRGEFYPVRNDIFHETYELDFSVLLSLM